MPAPFSECERQAYEWIGKAVGACQFLEISLALCAKLVFKYPPGTDAKDFEKLDGSFTKTRLPQLIELLKARVEVNPEFETHVLELMNRRHTLIHRWVLLHGWPTAGDEARHKLLREFAQNVTSDAVSLSKLLVTYIQPWVESIPGGHAKLSPLEAEWMASVPDNIAKLVAFVS